MFKIQKTQILSVKGRQTAYNVFKLFSNKVSGRPPFEKKSDVPSKLPCLVKNEDITSVS